MAIKTLKIGNKNIKVDDSILTRIELANKDKVTATGTPIMVNQSFRTREQQAQLYETLSKKGARVAPPGKSFHEKGKAVDVTNYKESEQYLRRYGLVNDLSGDKGHFSYGETNKAKYEKLTAKVEQGRKQGLTDTQLLDMLGSSKPDIGAKITQARQLYAGGGDITNDRDLLNFLSVKFSGKIPTVPSVAEKPKAGPLANQSKVYGPPAPENAMDKITNVVNKGFDIVKNAPGIKQVSQLAGGLVGNVGAAVGGAAAGFAEQFRQGARAIQGKGYDPSAVISAAKTAGKGTKEFGQQIGSEAVPASMLGALGRVPNAVIAGTQIYQGAKQAKEAVKSGDVVGATQAGLSIGLGAVGAKHALAKGSQGLLVNPRVKETIARPIANKFPSTKPILFPVEHFGEKAAKALQENTLRLTPVQKQTMEKQVSGVVDYLTKNKIKGSPEARYQAVKEQYEAMEPKLQSFLTNDAKNLHVNKNKIKSQIKSIKEKYVNDRDYLAIEKQLDDFNALLDKNYKLQIPLARLNDLKRSTYKGAFNKAGNKVLDAVEFDIGDILRQNITDLTDKLNMKVDGKSIHNFNQEYSTLINAKKLLKVAKSRNEVGLIGKLAGGAAGASIGSAFGGPVGAGLGAIAGPKIGTAVAGTAVKTYLSALLETVSKPTNEALKLNPAIKKIQPGLTIKNVYKDDPALFEIEKGLADVSKQKRTATTQSVIKALDKKEKGLILRRVERLKQLDAKN